MPRPSIATAKDAARARSRWMLVEGGRRGRMSTAPEHESVSRWDGLLRTDGREAM